jgi:hypothetical protein
MASEVQAGWSVVHEGLRDSGLPCSPRGKGSWGLRVFDALDGLGICGMRSARSKGAKDSEYLAWLHLYACVVCMGGAIRVIRGAWPTPVHAHHAGAHGMSQKCPDREAIPLCRVHHTDGPTAAHVLGKGFWKHHGLDKDDLIRRLNELYDSMKARGR